MGEFSWDLGSGADADWGVLAADAVDCWSFMSVGCAFNRVRTIRAGFGACLEAQSGGGHGGRVADVGAISKG